MIIAVTGANGHVGVNVCTFLQRSGHEVRALCHKNDYGLKHVSVKCHKGDLLDPESLRLFLAGADAVIHLAAKISIQGDPDGSVRKINVDGTKNILHAARVSGIKKFIHFSSIHAINQNPRNEALNESRPLVTTGSFSYDLSKAEGEQAVLESSRDGFDAVVLSPTAIIGPADYEPSLTGKAMLQLYHGQIPALVPGGYNWVDVRDVAEGCIAALERGRKGEKYLLPGEWIDLKNISSLINRITWKKTPSLVLPFWVAKAGLPFTTLYARMTGNEPLYTAESLDILNGGNRHISGEKARKELGFAPRRIEETIRDLFTWFKEKELIN